MSAYIGHNGNAIVAMGVSHHERSPRRYVAIAAGSSYAFLNSTQCELTFTPSMFNVTVDVANFNISVKPLFEIRDFNPQRNLTRTVVRQFELLSNDLTNLYVSLLGDALNSSIAAYNMSRSASARATLTESEATLAGLTNSVTAMADDMLVAYASAQLMVGKMFTQQSAKVYLYGLQFGQRQYIYSIWIFNAVVLLTVAAEALRTRGWRELGRFNYLDPRDLIIAASRGGPEVAKAADALACSERVKRMKHVWLLSDPDEGNGQLVVRMRGDESGHVGIVVTPLTPRTPTTSSRIEGGFSGTEKGAGEMDIDAEKLAAKKEWEKRRKKQRVGLFGSTK
jgi:hypothetical protein